MDVISCGFFFMGVNGASFVRTSSDIWVTGCNYVESVTLCGNVVIFHCVSLEYIYIYIYIYSSDY